MMGAESTNAEILLGMRRRLREACTVRESCGMSSSQIVVEWEAFQVVFR